MNKADETVVKGRTRDVLEAIARLENLGEHVTTSRLAAELGLPRQNIRGYLLALLNRGAIRYPASGRQTVPIHLTEQGWNVAVTRRTPRAEEHGTLTFPVLGEVAAGHPTLASTDIEARATRLQDVLDLHEGDFLLRVRGESMMGIGIYPGDLVAIHPTTQEPLSGEIALVAVPGEETATLKRWHRNNGTVTLRSENPAYPPLTYPADDLLVQGWLVGHIGTGRARRSHTSEA
ncbi:S24 family peptidase [Deinococcus sp.]|uniref:LexA family protein n=1 Tax=Deinococcus sp. TaxID=47478 RepID=UPI0025C676E9|nr:S24 family peptidase [Deinococcus sp.]